MMNKTILSEIDAGIEVLEDKLIEYKNENNHNLKINQKGFEESLVDTGLKEINTLKKNLNEIINNDNTIG